MKSSDYNTAASGCRRRRKQYISAAAALLLLMFLLAVFMMTYGNTVYTPGTVISVLMGNHIKGASFTLLTLRLPRLLAAILCGAAFGMAGNTFQKLLGNPLASPDIIGVSSGASTAAVFGSLVLGLSGNAVSFLAVAFGLLVSMLLYVLSRNGGFSGGRLILTGIGMQALLNAAISWMLLRASEYDVPGALRWLSGSLNGIGMDRIPGLAAAVLTAGTAVLLLSRYLMILELGEAYAITLGVKIGLIRLLLILFSLLLIAFATAVTGPIASVAFLSGPVAARISGSSGSNTAVSALTGSVLVLASDLAGQFALPSRYPAGVITGILGAPYLLFLLLRMNRKGENAL